MTHKSAALSFCKYLSKQPFTSEIRNLIKYFTQIDPMTNLSDNNSLYWDAAKSFGHQFYGLFHSYLRRDDMKEVWGFAPPEVPDEMKIITKKAHNTILYIQNRLISKLISDFPNLEPCFNIYTYLGPVRFDASIYDIDEDEILKLIDSFNKTIPVNKIYKMNRSLVKGFDGKSSSVFLQNLDYKIRQSDLTKDPDSQVAEALMRGETFRSNNPLAVLIFTIICIRDILHTMSQLIYQAMFQEKIPILTQDHVFELNNGNSNVVCRYGSLSSQIDLGAPFLDIHMIFFLSITTKKRDVKLLGYSTSFQLNMDHVEGLRQHIVFYEIDNDCNCLSSLLRE